MLHRNSARKVCSVKGILTIIILSMELLLVSTFLGCANNEQFDYKKYYESVFEIKCTSESHFESIGTGYKMKNYIITNAHLVSYKNEIDYLPYESISAKSGKDSFEYPLNIIAFDREKDIAILYPKDYFETFSQIPNLQENKNCELGQEVFSIGNMNGYGLSLSVGIISNKEIILQNTVSAERYIQTNIVIAKGCSGGPVFDYEGNVIGMMTFKLRDTNGDYIDGMSFAIPIEEISHYLENKE